MLRRLGHVLCQGIAIACLVGVVLAVPIGYLGIFLNHDGLLMLAAFLALPFCMLSSLALLYVPLTLLALIWFAVKEWLIPKVLRRGAG